MKPCLLFLSCKDKKEADKISFQLLTKKLIVCAKKISIDSSYLWNDKIESDNEILLIMDSVKEHFDGVNREVKKLHSYDTYNLVMVDASKLNSESLTWLSKCVGERT